jgi:hypothetical protein
MTYENQTPEQQEANVEGLISKQLNYLERTLLVNINFAEKQHLNTGICSEGHQLVVEMNRDLLDVLAEVRDDYQRP